MTALQSTALARCHHPARLMEFNRPNYIIIYLKNQSNPHRPQHPHNSTTGCISPTTSATFAKFPAKITGNLISQNRDFAHPYQGTILHRPHQGIDSVLFGSYQKNYAFLFILLNTNIKIYCKS